MLENVVHAIFALGRVGPGGVQPLGTGFAVSKNKLATAAHVVGASDANLVAIIPRVNGLSDYQDQTDTSVKMVEAKITAYDAIRDIAIVAPNGCDFRLGYTIGGIDNVLTGTGIWAAGYPHADHGRLILTAQSSTVGARILLGEPALKHKHIIMNVQTRPGQSGSPVFLQNSNEVCAMVLGSYAPQGSGLSFGGVDPQTLHQTTHAISAEYISGML